MNQKPIICLDYDGTYTRFPDLLDLIVKHCKDKNYEIILATMRYESEKDIGLEVIEMKGVKIIYTNRQAKYLFLQSIGIKPDLWIDDEPKWLFQNG